VLEGREEDARGEPGRRAESFLLWEKFASESNEARESICKAVGSIYRISVIKDLHF
jgi:hypothetical protein